MEDDREIKYPRLGLGNSPIVYAGQRVKKRKCDLSSHEILGDKCVTGRILLLIHVVFRLRIAYCCAVVRDKTDKTFGCREE